MAAHLHLEVSADLSADLDRLVGHRNAAGRRPRATRASVVRALVAQAIAAELPLATGCTNPSQNKDA